MLHWKYSTLTSLIVLGWLTNSYSFAPEDLPGFNEENAIKANPGAVILYGTVKSGFDFPYDQDRADSILSGSPLHKQPQGTSTFLTDLIIDGVRHEGAGYSWLYGIQPDTDWRSAFNSSRAMQRSFYALFPNKSDYDKDELEIIKATFAQEWIIASHYNIEPLAGDFSGHTEHDRWLAQNIHRILPSHDRGTHIDDHEATLAKILKQIPCTQYVEFIKTLETHLDDEMDFDTQVALIDSVCLLSGHNESIKNIVYYAFHDLIHSKDLVTAVKAIPAESRSEYFTTVSPFLPMEGELCSRTCFATYFATFVMPEDYRTVSDALTCLTTNLVNREEAFLGLLLKPLSKFLKGAGFELFQEYFELLFPRRAERDGVFKFIYLLADIEISTWPPLMKAVEPFLAFPLLGTNGINLIRYYSEIKDSEYKNVTNFINEIKGKYLEPLDILESLQPITKKGEFNLGESLKLLRKALPEGLGDHHHSWLYHPFGAHVRALAAQDPSDRTRFVDSMSSLYKGLKKKEQSDLSSIFGGVDSENVLLLAQTILDVEKKTGMNRLAIANELKRHTEDTDFIDNLKNIDFDKLTPLRFHKFCTVFKKFTPDQRSKYIQKVNEAFDLLVQSGTAPSGKPHLFWAFLRINHQYGSFYRNLTTMKKCIPTNAKIGIMKYADYLSRISISHQRNFNKLVRSIANHTPFNPYTHANMQALAGNPELNKMGIPPVRYEGSYRVLKGLEENTKHTLPGLAHMFRKVDPNDQPEFLALVQSLDQPTWELNPYTSECMDVLTDLSLPYYRGNVKPMLDTLQRVDLSAVQCVAFAITTVKDPEKYLKACEVLLHNPKRSHFIKHLLEPLEKVGPKHYDEFITLVEKNFTNVSDLRRLTSDKSLSHTNFRHKMIRVEKKV